MSGDAMESITLGIDRDLRYKRKLIIPQSNSVLKQAILAETHNSEFTIHSGNTKMY